MPQTTITFAISDLAREFGITPRTIRFWEDQGILAPEREGSKRVFTRRDRARLKMALRGKRLGLSLAEIKDLIGMYASPRTKRRNCWSVCASCPNGGKRSSSSVRTSRRCWLKFPCSSNSAGKSWYAAKLHEKCSRSS